MPTYALQIKVPQRLKGFVKDETEWAVQQVGAPLSAIVHRCVVRKLAWRTPSRRGALLVVQAP